VRENETKGEDEGQDEGQDEDENESVGVTSFHENNVL
jgi:hypothetical protein